MRREIFVIETGVAEIRLLSKRISATRQFGIQQQVETLFAASSSYSVKRNNRDESILNRRLLMASSNELEKFLIFV